MTWLRKKMRVSPLVAQPSYPGLTILVLKWKPMLTACLRKSGDLGRGRFKLVSTARGRNSSPLRHKKCEPYFHYHHPLPGVPQLNKNLQVTRHFNSYESLCSQLHSQLRQLSLSSQRKDALLLSKLKTLRGLGSPTTRKRALHRSGCEELFPQKACDFRFRKSQPFCGKYAHLRIPPETPDILWTPFEVDSSLLEPVVDQRKLRVKSARTGRLWNSN